MNVLIRMRFYLQMFKVHSRVEELKTDEGYAYAERCFRLPVLKIPDQNPQPAKNRVKRQFEDDFFGEFSEEDFDSEFDDTMSKIMDGEANEGNFDPSILFYPDPYCNTVNNMPTACFEESILEIFAQDGKYNVTQIETLTQEDIITKINSLSTR